MEDTMPFSGPLFLEDLTDFIVECYKTGYNRRKPKRRILRPPLVGFIPPPHPQLARFSVYFCLFFKENRCKLSS